MGQLPASELQKLGLTPGIDLHRLADTQIRRIMAACARCGAVEYSIHAFTERADRRISPAMALACLRMGKIARGAEMSKGGGVSLRLQHTIAGETFQIEAAVDQAAGPTIVVTVIRPTVGKRK